MRDGQTLSGRCTPITREVRVNERIRSREVRIIGEAGEQVGVLPVFEGIRLARERGLDLVEVAPQSVPPVCRIMDYSKFKYELSKREREAKKRQHVMHLKEIKFKPHINEHDYQVKLSAAKKFLERGDKTKITMVYRGREMAHMELGRRVIDRVVQDLAEVSAIEKTPALEGRFMTMVMSPKNNK